MLMTKAQLQAKAEAAGYEDYRGYADDNELIRCDICHRWGRWGDEIIESETDKHCEACYDALAEARTDYATLI